MVRQHRKHDAPMGESDTSDGDCTSADHEEGCTSSSDEGSSRSTEGAADEDCDSPPSMEDFDPDALGHLPLWEPRLHER